MSSTLITPVIINWMCANFADNNKIMTTCTVYSTYTLLWFLWPVFAYPALLTVRSTHSVLPRFLFLFFLKNIISDSERVNNLRDGKISKLTLRTAYVPDNKSYQHHIWAICCLKVSEKAVCQEMLRAVIVLPSWTLMLPLVCVFPLVGHEREELGLGTSVGLPWYHITSPHTCPCQSAGTAASRGDFSS